MFLICHQIDQFQKQVHIDHLQKAGCHCYVILWSGFLPWPKTVMSCGVWPRVVPGRVGASVKLRHPSTQHHNISVQSRTHRTQDDSPGHQWHQKPWRGYHDRDRGVPDQDELPPRPHGHHLHPAVSPADSLCDNVSIIMARVSSCIILRHFSGSSIFMFSAGLLVFTLPTSAAIIRHRRRNSS